MFRQPNVLMISREWAESSELERILKRHAELHVVCDLDGLESAIQEEDYDAVFCGWSFHEGNWNSALEQMQQRSPDVPVIIFCGAGGEWEWFEVLDAGAFDFLAAPYLENTVLPALEHAVVSHEAQLYKSTRPLMRAAS